MRYEQSSLEPRFGRRRPNPLYHRCHDHHQQPTPNMTTNSDPRLGVVLWSQGSDWDGFEAAAIRAEDLGYDHLWTWDHLYAIFGNPLQPIFEGWAALAAWAKVTTQIRLGLLVGANTFRNPGLAAKLATTLDHISGGRAILGLGGAWFELEHQAYGIEFGSSPGKRLVWLDEAAGVVRALLAGEVVTHDGPRYKFDRLHMVPGPVQRHLPLMIGGGGERKTFANRGQIRRHVECVRRPAHVCKKDRGPPGALRVGGARSWRY